METSQTIMMTLGSIPIGYFGALIATQLTTTLFRKKIDSESELNKIIKEEAEKIELDPSKIRGSFYSLPSGSGKRCWGRVLY